MERPGDHLEVRRGQDPPDAWIGSDIAAEVVRAPRDPAIHHDNENARFLEEALKAALNERGVRRMNVSVIPSETALRRGFKKRMNAIAVTADSIYAAFCSTPSAPRQFLSSDVAIPEEVRDLVSHLAVILCPHNILEVSAGSGSLMPRDATWIIEAIEDKAKKYAGRITIRNPILIIDGSTYILPDQIASFRSLPKKPTNPFAEIWVVNEFQGAVRIS